MGTARTVKILGWLIIMLLGAIQAWATRFTISSEDGIAYLDIGDAYWRGDWSHAINGQWSPAYSVILGIVMKVFHPSSYWQFPLVKVVDFLIFVFTFGSFELFLRRLRISDQTAHSQGVKAPAVSDRAWWLLGYTLFAWFALKWVGVSSDTPDMLTAAFVFLSGGMVLHLKAPSNRWLHFAVLGVVLGLGYLSKAVMFPLSLVFLTVAFASVGEFRKAIPLTALALIAFGLTSGPFISALSRAKGHYTYGEAGKLNYAWFINPGSFLVPDHHWQGGPEGSGKPIHPTRKIFETPQAFEFGTPVGGTYPPWYDPTYWFQGLTVKFSAARQLQVLIKNAIFYLHTFLALGIFGYLLLIVGCDSARASLSSLYGAWRLLVPAAAGLGVYMLDSDLELNFFGAQPDTRYIGAFIVLLFAGAFASVRLPTTPAAKKLLGAFALATIISVGGLLVASAIMQFKAGVASKPREWEIAEGLGQWSLASGSKVANLGLKEYGWARLGGFKIVAEIPDAAEFWTARTEDRNQVLEKIRYTGARVIVLNPTLKIPAEALREGWREIGTTGAYAYRF